MSRGLVRQRTAYDCGICALSMASGIDYENITKIANLSDRIGLTSWEMCNVLGSWGFEYKFLVTKDCLQTMDTDSGMARAGLSQSGIRNLIGNKEAILTVRGSGGSFHAVFYDGSFVRDPASFREKLIRNQEIMEAIIVTKKPRLKLPLPLPLFG